jgi:hypothetical protein
VKWSVLRAVYRSVLMVFVDCLNKVIVMFCMLLGV